MTVLVTGGTGFIGREVVRLLADRGEEVVAFSRDPSPSRLGELYDRCIPVAGDVGVFSHILNAVEEHKPHTIYHLGAMLSAPSEADPAASIQTNAMGTFYVLEAARLFGVAKVVFASSIATYGRDLPEAPVDDGTLQRPTLFYGATKAFGEHMGLYYRRRHGLDFRGIRYPSVIGPGVTTKGVAQYTSWMIEAAAAGQPFSVWAPPETSIPVMYIAEAATATLMLADAPKDAIRTVSYIVNGARPTPTAGEIADAVRQRVQGAEITFDPDPDVAPLLKHLTQPLDDAAAMREWGWRPTHDLTRIVDDFMADRQRST